MQKGKVVRHTILVTEVAGGRFAICFLTSLLQCHLWAQLKRTFTSYAKMNSSDILLLIGDICQGSSVPQGLMRVHTAGVMLFFYKVFHFSYV